ncbi:unnamed protein product [Lampetra fluviatilis]
MHAAWKRERDYLEGITGTTAGVVIAPETDGAGAPPSSPRAADGWQRIAEQQDSLHTVLLQLVTLVKSSAVTDRPRDVSPTGDEQKPLQGISEGPPWESTAAIADAGGLFTITHMVDATRQKAIILGTAVEMRSEPTISVKPRGEPPGGGVERSHHLPHIKEFVAVGGDWSAFTWLFESAFRSVRWTEEEALGALPTVLDDQALAVFRSIPPDKKKTLKDVYAEMAEVYQPLSDTQRKFMPRKRGSNESLLAYHGTLLALAVAAYPDAKPEMLDPLILDQLSDEEIKRKCGFSLKEIHDCKYAKCLNASIICTAKNTEQTADDISKCEGDHFTDTDSKCLINSRGSMEALTTLKELKEDAITKEAEQCAYDTCFQRVEDCLSSHHSEIAKNPGSKRKFSLKQCAYIAVDYPHECEQIKSISGCVDSLQKCIKDHPAPTPVPIGELDSSSSSTV